jgi:hypothetical protein
MANVICPNCDNSEAEGTPFCGVCGADLRLTQPRLTKRNPLLLALVAGLVAGGLITAGLSLAQGDGAPESTVLANAPSGAVTAQPSSPTATVAIQQASPTPTATPLLPTATPTEAPAATEEPPPPTEAPPPPPTNTPPPPPPPTSTPVPQGPAVPPQKTSNLVGLTITGGHGSSHRVGANLQLCYSSAANQYISLYSSQAPGNPLRQGVDDGRGECFNVTVSPPTGVDRIRIDAYNAGRTAVVDYAELSIIVVP